MSSDRLAQALRSDIADLQVQLEETILRSEVYLAAGLTDQASAVVDEQQGLISAMHERLDGHVAAASIEADAESILADSLDREFGTSLARPVVDDERVTPLSAARSAASVLVGAVAAVALMIMASSPPGPTTFAAAGVQDDRDTDLASDLDTPDTDPGAPGDATARSDDERDRVAGPNDLEVRRLFATPGPSERDDAVDDGDPAGLPDLPVFQIQALVANVVSTVEGVAEAARDSWERGMSERPEEQQADGPSDDRDEPGSRSQETTPFSAPADEEGDGSSAPSDTDEGSEDAPAQDETDGTDASARDDDGDDEPAGQLGERLGGTVADLEQ